jgi:CHAT domain-containing protein
MAHDLLALRLRPADLEKATVARWKDAGFENAGAWKARSLVDSLIRRRSSGPPQESEPLRAARATLAQTRERLGVLARLRAEDPLLQEEYRKVTRARQNVEELERTAEGGVAGDRTALASRGVSPGIARTALHDDRTALIEFAAGVRNLYAYVLTRDHLELLNLGARRPIEEDARCFLSLLATNRLPKGAPARFSADVGGLVAVGRSLYASLLAKALATAGPKVDHLIVVPTTELADMPFEALIGPISSDSGTGFGGFGFVVRKYTILYAPSSPALVELGVSTRAKRSPSLMIFADPVYPDPAAAAIAQAGPREGSGDSADPMRGMELESLGYTRLEASQIASLFSSLSASPSAADALAIQEIQNGLRNHHRSDAGFELFLGPEATPRRFRENAGRCTILHVAAHGCRSTRAYADPILALSPENGGNSALTCQQILQLDLNADLVVLAACDTARGRKIDGDGIQSLARAFLHAGARDVVASLWEMKDPAVGGLMIRLYRQLLKGGLSRADALHQVKLDMLTGDVSRGNSPTEKDQIARFTDSADPGLWAAFVILGAPE